MSENDPSKFCKALDQWAELMIKAKSDRDVKDRDSFRESWRDVRLAITKSCLLSRTIYLGEQPSQTKCPVHNGIWIGIHSLDSFDAPMSDMMAKWYDHPEWAGKSERELGCRCNLHKCGCTTGWNTDEHCGCLTKP